jgi:hypothetical protein
MHIPETSSKCRKPVSCGCAEWFNPAATSRILVKMVVVLGRGAADQHTRS